MRIEIERKFLLKDKGIIPFLQSLGVKFKTIQIEQFYTQITKNQEIKYTKSDQIYTKTIKNGSGFLKEKLQTICDKNEYELAIKKHLASIIKKTSYAFKINNNQAFIDVFDNDLDELCVLRIEFQDELYGVFFKLKEPFSEFLISDVSDKSEFKSKNLAIFGNPSSSFNLNFVKEILLNHQMDINFPKNISSKDALRILLLQIYKNFDINDTINFIYNLKTTYAIFKFLPNVFDEKTSENFLNKFKILMDKFTPYSELQNCQNYIKDSDLKGFVAEVANLSLNEAKSTLDQDTMGFLKEWELFLNEESDFFDDKLAGEKIIKQLAYNIRKKLILTQKMAINLNDRSSNYQFYEIYEAYFEIYAVLKAFKTLYNTKNINKFIKKFSSLKELFDELNALDTILKANENYFDTQKSKQKLSAKTYEKIYKIRNKIIKKARKFINLKRLMSRNFKIYY